MLRRFRRCFRPNSTKPRLAVSALVQSMDDETFLQQFEAANFTAEQWHHPEHIKVAYLYLCRYSFDESVDRMRAGLKTLNAKQNVPESLTRGYHETLTQVWMRLVQLTIELYGTAESSDVFYQQSPQLSQPKVLRLFYSRDVIMSAQAKAEFVEPDLTPLPTSKKLAAPGVFPGAK